jgi:hypothetical protein
VGNWLRVVSLAGRRWWVWTARPTSLRVTWRQSAVDPKRIPGKAGALRWLWLLSNGSDRLLMFALLFVAPSGLQGPLRWIAPRPTRRWGAYLIAAVLAVAWLLGRE